jgi:hypothetical protein
MTDTPPTPPRTYVPGPVMFWLAFLHLILIAGVVHRAHHPEATRLEIQIMGYGLLALWPLIVLETWIAVLIRDRAVRPRGSSVVRAIWITGIPPLRMGMPCPFTGRLWLPRWGWCERGKALEDRLDRAFHKPMLVFAILILPILALEFTKVEDVKTNRWLALALHFGIAIIWVAFAVEFSIKVSAARKPFKYCKERWLDLAIVTLPLLEFLLTYLANAALLSRLLRVARAAGPEQIARMGQIYRLRGLLTKGWKAILVLRLVAKLTRNTPQKQLKKLEEQIAEMELTLTDLRAQADELRKQCPPAEPVEKTEVAPVGES